MEVLGIDGLDNYGGIARIWLALCKDAPNFSLMYHIEESADYKFAKNRDNKGRYFEHNLKFKIPKFRKALNNYFEKLQSCCGVVLMLETYNGDTFTIGTKKMPLKFDYDFVAGTAVKDLQHYNISVTGKSLRQYESLTTNSTNGSGGTDNNSGGGAGGANTGNTNNGNYTKYVITTNIAVGWNTINHNLALQDPNAWFLSAKYQNELIILAARTDTKNSIQVYSEIALNQVHISII